MPEVSVIVPNYNHAPFLNERIESILRQSYSDYEVILLDDASSDKSKEILEGYRDHEKVSRVLINGTNSGSPFKQWKKGIEHALGTYIWIAESDDFCSPEFLQSCLNTLTSDPEIGIVYSQSVDVDPDGREISGRLSFTEEFNPNIWEDDFRMNGMDFIHRYLSHKNVLPNASAVVFKKSLIHSEEIFEEIQDMRMCGDWYFWLGLAGNTRVAFISSPLNKFRQHPGMSRRQTSLEAKKRRLVEEAEVRAYLVRMVGLDQSVFYKNIRDKWFRLSHKWSIFKKDFYRVKDPSVSKLTFGLQCWMFKLKNRWN